MSGIYKGAFTFLRLSGIYPPYEITGFDDEFLENKSYSSAERIGNIKNKIKTEFASYKILKRLAIRFRFFPPENR